MAKEKDNLALDASAKDKIAAHLRNKAPLLACPVCGHRDFFVNDHLVTANIVSPSGGVNLGGTTYPMATITCQNCLHTMSFAAVPMGLVGGQQASAESLAAEDAAEEPGDG